MREALACLLCGRAGILLAHARVAPFIEELTTRSRFSTALLECRECDLAWFSDRFDEPTMAALYGGYRDAAYLRIRRRWEPWYSGSLNSALEPGSAAVDERITFMVDLLAPSVDVAGLRNIVDIGGDAGQFFPPFDGPKYIVDVSGRELVSGVIAVGSVADLPEPPHMLVVAHLLEHLPDPAALLRELRAAIAPDGHLYVEVPLDRPRVSRWHSTGLYDRYLSLVRRSRPTWVAADFMAGAARNLGWTVPLPAAVKQSEHINYFSARSIVDALERSRFRITRVRSDPRATVGGLRLGRLGVHAVPA